MDAVSIALPTNALTSATMAAGENAAPTGDGKGVAIDFATLLAAGLNLQQPLPGEAISSPEPARDKALDDEPALDPAPLVADPGQMLAPATALPTVVPVVEHIPQAAQRAGHSDTPDATLKLQTGAAQHESAKPTSTVAESASLAAAPDKPAAHSDARLRLELAQQTRPADAADGPRAEAAGEAAAHALNLQSVGERPSVHQPTAVLEIAPHVSSPGFADAVSKQVVWMVDKDAQVAELRINPPELGPVEVRLTVNGDQASAQFVSTHQEVREALETAIARLRESFAEAGIQLGQASVSAESFRDQAANQSDARTAGRTAYGAANGTGESTATVAPIPVRRGLVDTFA